MYLIVQYTCKWKVKMFLVNIYNRSWWYHAKSLRCTHLTHLCVSELSYLSCITTCLKHSPHFLPVSTFLKDPSVAVPEGEASTIMPDGKWSKVSCAELQITTYCLESSAWGLQRYWAAGREPGTAQPRMHKRSRAQIFMFVCLFGLLRAS